MTRNGNEVAIIGFAINVPGANDVDAYWKMILEREEALSDISDDVLRSKGVSPHLLTDKNYVKKAFTVPDSDKLVNNVELYHINADHFGIVHHPEVSDVISRISRVSNMDVTK